MPKGGNGVWRRYYTERERKSLLRLRLRPETAEECYRYENDYPVGEGSYYAESWPVDRQHTTGDEETKADTSPQCNPPVAEYKHSSFSTSITSEDPPPAVSTPPSARRKLLIDLTGYDSLEEGGADAIAERVSAEVCGSLHRPLDETSRSCTRQLLQDFDDCDSMDEGRADLMDEGVLAGASRSSRRACAGVPAVSSLKEIKRTKDTPSQTPAEYFASAIGARALEPPTSSIEVIEELKDKRLRTTKHKKQHRTRALPSRDALSTHSPRSKLRTGCRWPSDVISLRHHFNPDDVRFSYESPFSGMCGCALRCEDQPCPFGDDQWCGCRRDCRKGSCPNAMLGIYCAPNCCELGGKCGNGLVELEALELIQHEGDRGYGVQATTLIEEGVVIGQYLGHIKVEDRTSGDMRPTNSGYRFEISRSASSHPNKVIVIDAEGGGSITRFINHSCRASCAFHEVRNSSNHTVVVVTTRDVMPGEELTVNYGSSLWFICRCGEPTCQHRDINRGDDA